MSGGSLSRTHFELDFRSGAPIYVQIVEQVRGWIAKGQLNPGDQLPTVRQLALELRVNLNTVARAYRILDEAGIISTQRGRGTYIWEKPTEEMMRQLKKKSMEELARTYLEEAGRLGFSLADALEELKLIHADDPQAVREATLEDKNL
jgi:GntR family transcriptional regulator